MGESPSVLMHASARGLGKLAGFMANRGKLNDDVLLSEAGWDELHAEPKVERDFGTGARTTFTKGGLCKFGFEDFPKEGASQLELNLNSQREGFYGWMGIGGSIFQWHPEHKVGFAYVPSDFAMLDTSNARGGELQKAVLQCIKGKEVTIAY